eukprot:m.32799 g.32799  ORF g.32799 m.32799 type:complete len:52 (+) comp9807_c0_seq1:680-835(+)
MGSVFAHNIDSVKSDIHNYKSHMHHRLSVIKLSNSHCTYMKTPLMLSNSTT